MTTILTILAYWLLLDVAIVMILWGAAGIREVERNKIHSNKSNLKGGALL